MNDLEAELEAVRKELEACRSGYLYQREQTSRLTSTNLELVERERRLREALERMPHRWDCEINKRFKQDYSDACRNVHQEHCDCGRTAALSTPTSELGKRVEKVIETARALHKSPVRLNDGLMRALDESITNLDALSGGKDVN